MDALTDGLLVVRHAFGLQGSSLVSGAVATSTCDRCTAEAIEGYLDTIAQE